MTTRRPIDTVTGLAQTRQSMGDGTIRGRSRIATPYDPRRLRGPISSRRSPAVAALGEIVKVVTVDPTTFVHNGDIGTPVVFNFIEGERHGFVSVPAALPTSNIPYTGVRAPCDVQVLLLGDHEAENDPLPVGTRIRVLRNGTRILPEVADDPDWRCVSSSFNTGEIHGIANFARGDNITLMVVPPVGKTITLPRISMKIRIPDPIGLTPSELPTTELELPTLNLLAHYSARLQHDATPFGLVDHSGNFRNATGVTGVTWQDDQLNNHPAWTMSAASTDAVDLGVASHIIAAICRVSGGAGSPRSIVGVPFGSPTAFGEYAGVNAGDTWFSGGQAGGVVDTSWHVVVWGARQAGSDTRWVRVDGVTVTSGTDGSGYSGATSRRLFRVACVGCPISHWVGQVMDLAIYSSTNLSADLAFTGNEIEPALSSISGINLS